MIAEIGNFEISRDTNNWIISRKSIVDREGSKNHGKVAVRPVAYLGSLTDTLKRIKEMFLEDNFETKASLTEVEEATLEHLKQLDDLVKSGTFN